MRGAAGALLAVARRGGEQEGAREADSVLDGAVGAGVDFGGERFDAEGDADVELGFGVGAIEACGERGRTVGRAEAECPNWPAASTAKVPMFIVP